MKKVKKVKKVKKMKNLEMRMPEINLETNSFDGVTYHGSIVITVSKPTQTVVCHGPIRD